MTAHAPVDSDVRSPFFACVGRRALLQVVMSAFGQKQTCQSEHGGPGAKANI
jgi:hypothetical protein